MNQNQYADAGPGQIRDQSDGLLHRDISGFGVYANGRLSGILIETESIQFIPASVATASFLNETLGKIDVSPLGLQIPVDFF